MTKPLPHRAELLPDDPEVRPQLLGQAGFRNRGRLDRGLRDRGHVDRYDRQVGVGPDQLRERALVMVDRLRGLAVEVLEQLGEDACDAGLNGTAGHAQLHADVVRAQSGDVPEAHDHSIVGVERGQGSLDLPLLGPIRGRQGGSRDRRPGLADHRIVLATIPASSRILGLLGGDRHEPRRQPLGIPHRPEATSGRRPGGAHSDLRHLHVVGHHEGDSRHVVVIALDDSRERRGIALGGLRQDVTQRLVGGHDRRSPHGCRRDDLRIRSRPRQSYGVDLRVGVTRLGDTAGPSARPRSVTSER